jgi:hypothetical protein
MGLMDIFTGNDQRAGLLGGFIPNGATPDEQQSSQRAKLAFAAALLGNKSNFGQALGNAIGAGQGAYDAGNDNALMAKFKQAQIGHFTQQSELERQKALAEQRKADSIAQVTGGPQSATGALTQGAAAGDIGPTVGNAARMNNALPMMPGQQGQQGSWLQRATPDQIAGLKMNGMDVTDIYKLAREGVEKKPGSFYTDLYTGKQVYQADPTKGRSFENGVVGTLPGALQTTTAETLANKVPEAFLSAMGKVNLRDSPDGTKSPVNELEENPMLSDFMRKYMGGPLPQKQGAQYPAAITPDVQRLIQQDAQKNGIQSPVVNMTGSAPGQTFGLAGRPAYGKTTAQEAEAKSIIDAGPKVNDTWLKTGYEPTIEAGRVAQGTIDSAQVARRALQSMGKTGWGTETKAAAANVLAGLGIAPKAAEQYASDAQVFQKTAMDRLWNTLNAAKGAQTEGDAVRASKTFAKLANTTQANEFILDMAQANAERDRMKSAFYSNALPTAKSRGDLTEIDREWSKRMPSLFNMPTMKRWGQ